MPSICQTIFSIGAEPSCISLTGRGCSSRDGGDSFTGSEACCGGGVRMLGRICSADVGAPCVIVEGERMDDDLRCWGREVYFDAVEIQYVHCIPQTADWQRTKTIQRKSGASIVHTELIFPLGQYLFTFPVSRASPLICRFCCMQ